MEKIAVVYYSLKDETIAPGMKIVNLEKGHTERMSGHQRLRCDLFGLPQLVEYPAHAGGDLFGAVQLGREKDHPRRGIFRA
jgi:hypothetical protein